ncbi:hypothetical protein ACHQM5_003146 [Ranunculus cassubicifolius]
MFLMILDPFGLSYGLHLKLRILAFAVLDAEYETAFKNLLLQPLVGCFLWGIITYPFLLIWDRRDVLWTSPLSYAAFRFSVAPVSQSFCLFFGLGHLDSVSVPRFLASSKTVLEVDEMVRRVWKCSSGVKGQRKRKSSQYVGLTVVDYSSSVFCGLFYGCSLSGLQSCIINKSGLVRFVLIRRSVMEVLLPSFI